MHVWKEHRNRTGFKSLEIEIGQSLVFHTNWDWRSVYSTHNTFLTTFESLTFQLEYLARIVEDNNLHVADIFLRLENIGLYCEFLKFKLKIELKFVQFIFSYSFDKFHITSSRLFSSFCIPCPTFTNRYVTFDQLLFFEAKIFDPIFYRLFIGKKFFLLDLCKHKFWALKCTKLL